MTLHLIRHLPPPDGVVDGADLVLYDRDGAWTDPSGAPVSDDDLLAHIARADRVAVW
jgi:hypothetical protein